MSDARNWADTGRLGEALAACDALPDSARRWWLMGTVLARLDDEERARACFERAIDADDDGDGRLTLASLLGLAASHARAGQRMTAMEYVRIAEKLDGEDAVVRHLKKTLGNQGAETPLHGEVASLFDDYAEFYDVHIVDTLNYRGPELVAASVREHAADGMLPLVIDLGCGTGLCGPPVRDRAEALVGVDLSQEMVRKCRDVEAYDAAWQDDAVHALRTFATDSASAIMAGDVVGYIRDLEALLREASRVLRADGVWVMCVEEADATADVVMGPARRLKFSENYIRRVAAEAALAVTALVRTTLREESGQPVEGLVVTLSIAGHLE